MAKENKAVKAAPAQKPEKKKAAKKSGGFSGLLQKVWKFFRDCKGEVKRITWPTVKTVFKNMGVVLVTVIALGLFIFLLDMGFMGILGLVMDVAR